MSLVAWLGARRNQPRRWLFALAALPIALFGLIGAEYEVFPLYLAFAALVLFQLLYPTLIMWFTVTLVCALITVAYGSLFLADIFSLVRRVRPSILTDPSDSLFFLVILAYFAAVTVGLLCSHPQAPQRDEIDA